MVVGTDVNFQDEVVNSDKLTIVDFWAAWCMPCRMIEPHIEELANEYGDKIKVVKFNVDENQQVPGQFGINGIPTVIYFKNGKIVEQIVGAMPKSHYKELIDKHI